MGHIFRAIKTGDETGRESLLWNKRVLTGSVENHALCPVFFGKHLEFFGVFYRAVPTP
jgi:hypothetical protein